MGCLQQCFCLHDVHESLFKFGKYTIIWDLKRICAMFIQLKCRNQLLWRVTWQTINRFPILPLKIPHDKNENSFVCQHYTSMPQHTNWMPFSWCAHPFILFTTLCETHTTYTLVFIASYVGKGEGGRGKVFLRIPPPLAINLTWLSVYIYCLCWYYLFISVFRGWWLLWFHWPFLIFRCLHYRIEWYLEFSKLLINRSTSFRRLLYESISHRKVNFFLGKEWQIF